MINLLFVFCFFFFCADLHQNDLEKIVAVNGLRALHCELSLQWLLSVSAMMVTYQNLTMHFALVYCMAQITF